MSPLPKDYLQEVNERLLLEKRVIGDHTRPPAENFLMILSYTDLEHLLLLFLNGVLVPEILHIAKCKSNGQMKSYLAMKQLLDLGKGSGTTATSVLLNSSNPDPHES